MAAPFSCHRSESVALATHTDVATRLGRELTEAEQKTATQVIETATGLIADAVDRTMEWAERLDPVSPVLRGICVERALAAIANPANLASESETLGDHTHAQTHRRAPEGGVLPLTPVEERMISRAVYGATTGSASAESPIDRIIDLREGRDPDEDPS
jgi:hypothetical protein